MEMTRPDLTAIAAACGRLVVTPHPFTMDGQTNVPAELLVGDTLAAFLVRHVPGIESGSWVVSLGGAEIPPAMWARTYPKHGHLIAARCVVRRQVASLIALAALTYFSAGIASSIYGAAGGTFVTLAMPTTIAAIQAGVVIAGSMLINKVLAPKVPNANIASAKTLYSLSSQRNSARPNEPYPVLLGVMRVTPDLAAQPYTEYQGDDQYLNMQLLGGINVHRVSDLTVGDTSIDSYEEVSLYYNSFSGMEHQDVPLYGNPDTIAGGELTYEDNSWVTRTGSTGARALQVDVQGNLYDTGGKRGMGDNDTTIVAEYRLVGASAWTPWVSHYVSNPNPDTLRFTWTKEVPDGQYEVRMRLTVPKYHDENDVCKFAWTQLKTIQQDTADFAGVGRVGLRIKATGQISGGLDTVRMTAHPKPLPVWTGSGWSAATTFEDGACNPGALILQVLRGIFAPDGTLQFGMGLPDDQIDVEGIKAFMLHCATRGFTYSKWLTEAISMGDILAEIALAGMGQFMWIDGSRPTVRWAASGQPDDGVVNMANMLKGTFSTTYTLSQAADGIEYSYLDRGTWETATILVPAPGVTDMLNPARITGEGVGTADHASVMARYHLAQSLYQYKTVAFGTDIEALDYRRMSMLSISHDMTQWGFGGRVMGAAVVNGKVVLTLDEPVPSLSTPYVGLRVPGGREYRVFAVQAFAGESDALTLVEPWPAGVPLPGNSDDNPAHDTLWCYDFKSAPGLRARVVSMSPQADLKGVDVLVVPESDEFWDYVYNGTYVPAPSQSSLPAVARPEAKNLVVTEHINQQGDTEWPELGLTWDTTGACDHCQVWAALDGEQLRLVDGNALGNRAKFRISGAGVWVIEVRPFDASGRVGKMAVALHGTQSVDLPPALVDYFTVSQIAGGLRRFAFGYTDSARRPGNYLGVQIRYAPDDVALSVADWDTLTPLADADEAYSAAFDTTRPDNGLWTFAARTVNTAGQLSNGLIRHTVELVQSVADADQVAKDLREGLDSVVGLVTGGVALPDLPPLPEGLALATARHAASLNRVSGELGQTAAQLLQAVMDGVAMQEQFSDAGFFADPITGKFKLYAVEANSQSIANLQILLDAVQHAITLRATTVEVDRKIAAATLNPADLELFEGMDSRVSVVEIALNSALQTLELTASFASVQDLEGRIAQATQRLDAQEGVLESKVSSADFQAAMGTINGTLAAVQQLMQASGGEAALIASVNASRQNTIKLNQDARASLRDTLAQWEKDERQAQQAASARDDMRAFVDDGLAAQASRMQELAAAMQQANQLLGASVAEETRALVEEGRALAERQDELVAQLDGTDDNVAAQGQAIGLMQVTVGDQGDLLSSVMQQQTALQGRVGGVEDVNSAQGSAIGGMQVTLGQHGDQLSSMQQAQTALTGRVGDVEGVNGAQGSALTGLQVTVGSQGDQLSGLSQSYSQLAVTVGDHSAAISQQYAALVSLEGEVSAFVRLVLDVNGHLAGFTITNNGVQSDFAVVADRFAVALGSTKLVPFVLGLVNGVPTLTLAGDFYADGSIHGRTLVVRSIRADHLDVDSLSAINANLGTVVAGLIRNASNSSFWNLNATGSATEIQFAGGKVLVRADGDVEMDRVNIRRRNVLATGPFYWGRLFVQENDGDGNWTGGWTPPAETVFYIDTGVDSYEAIDLSINQPFAAVVQCTTSTHWGSTGGGSPLKVFCDPGISVAVTHYPSGSGNSASPRLYLRVAVRVADIHANVQQFRLDDFVWSVFKL